MSKLTQSSTDFTTRLTASNTIVTGFTRVYDYAKVLVTAELLAECKFGIYTPSQQLSPEVAKHLAAFFDIIVGADNEEAILYLPSYILVHPEHGPLAYWKPNLGKDVTHHTYTFRYELADEAAAHLSEHFIPFGATEFIANTKARPGKKK